MTPIELSNLYQTLRTRVAVHCPNSCAEISLPLPSNFGDELAFYRLVNWGYVLVQEAAKIPLAFLTNLPPLKADNSFRKEVSRLRTYVAHNLDTKSTRDQKTYAFVHRWFKEACGRGTPTCVAHYGDCCAYLASRLQEVIIQATVAALLLLREARRIGTMTLPQIIEFVSLQVLGRGDSEGGTEPVDAR